MRFVTNFITARSRSYWITALFVVSGLPLLALLLFVSFRHYASEGLQAVADGRVVIIDVASGKAQGGIKSEALPAIAQAAAEADSKKPAPPLLPPASKELKDAPAPGLSEETELGLLPKTDGSKKPWDYYARAFDRKGTRPVVAVLVTGVGLGKEASDASLLLPKEMTLSISPYAQAPAVWAASARSLGHEVMIDLPAETLGFPADDPGPQALLTSNNVQDNEKHLRWVLTRFPGYIGVTLPARERFSTSTSAASVYKFLGSRGLMLAHGAPSVEDSVKEMARSASLPLVFSTIRLDEDLSSEAVQQQLLALENTARREGVVLIVTHAYPLTVKELSKWAEGLEKKGFILAPVSALARITKS